MLGLVVIFLSGLVFGAGLFQVASLWAEWRSGSVEVQYCEGCGHELEYVGFTGEGASMVNFWFCPVCDVAVSGADAEDTLQAKTLKVPVVPVEDFDHWNIAHTM